MKLIQGVFRSVNIGLSHQSHRSVRAFSIFSNLGTNDNQNKNLVESEGDFFEGIHGGIGGASPDSNSIFNQLDRIRNDSERYIGSRFHLKNRSKSLDGLDDNFNTLSDGMDYKLKKAASHFDMDFEEMEKDDFTFRPDVTFQTHSEYLPKDLDLTKPSAFQPSSRLQFAVTSEEVMQKADFRNVRFLANFITDAGIIIKRNQTKISAKAQRKVAREIKTARAFGLMPFTTMGTKHFVFGRTMEARDQDYEYDVYDAPVSMDTEDPLAE